MPYASVPTESKGDIKRAGEILSGTAIDLAQYETAIDLAGRWRACHAYPINTFNVTLRDKLRSFSGDTIVAQRLKRMPTIIDKLRRYPAMNLATMQDIAGVRAILNTPEEVLKLADQYRTSKNLAHTLTAEKNYINAPRSEDGYRSVHLMYKYKNKLSPAYDGLRIEVQIRTKLQHTWATAVETMGTLLGQALKSRQGNQDWLDFFAVVSAAFAHKEKMPVVPRFNHLSENDTCEAIAAADAKINALNTMRGVSVAASHISGGGKKGRSSFYHLIILDSLNKTVQITPYDRDSIEKATEEYRLVEARAAQGEKIEPVLVSAGPIEKLRRAYPSFFLDVNEFISIIEWTIENVRKNAALTPPVKVTSNVTS